MVAEHADDVVLQTVELGDPPWPTIDPFLFCVHHVDDYPAANGSLGPDASLEGRNLGQDFAGVDGWRMYHGQDLPGFPQHPHRGFETVTYVRRGLVDHSDSIGAAARFGRGDVQWLTAGRGIVHSETFPLLDPAGPNPLELFQIWLNLPAADKMAEPHFAMLWDADIPRLVVADDAGRVVEVTVIAGELAGLVPPAPPPRSWASRPDTDVAIWHVRVEPGASWTMPPAAHPDTVRTLYVFDGEGLQIGDQQVARGTGNVVRPHVAIPLTSRSGADVLVLQGRPIGEPVAQAGPFVMNDRAGVEQAFADYRATEFGGWPWPSDEPAHGDQGRFARRPDGSIEVPAERS
jgi:redox-sensitive bicupin YhaK (pirin superfamily)